MRVLGDWTLNTVTRPEVTSFGVISAETVPLEVGKTMSLTRQSMSSKEGPLWPSEPQ
jgi:hypothetical protein